MKFKCILTFFIFSTLTSYANGNNTFYDCTSDKVPAYYDILYTLQPDTVSIEEIANVNAHHQFYELPDSAKLSEAGKTYWIRANVINQCENESIILSFSRHHQVELYFRSTSGSYSVQKLGILTPFSKRPFASNHLFFQVPYQPGWQTYYFKVRAYYTLGLGFYVMSPAQVHNEDVANFLGIGLYFGMYLVVFFYVFLAFVRLREKIYAFYALYIFANILGGFASHLILHQYFGILKNDFFYETIPYELGTIAFILYAKELFKQRGISRLLNRIIYVSIFLRVVFFLAGYFVDYHILFSPLLDFALLFPVYYLAIANAIKRYTPSYIFLFAGLFMIFGYFSHSIGDIFPTLSSKLYLNEYISFFTIGNLVEVLFFLLAISDKMRLLRKEKEQEHNRALSFQIELLKKSRENEILKDNLNKELEKLVAERTQELKIANDELQLQAIEINSMNEFLKQHNVKLQHDVELLTNARIMKPNVDFAEFEKMFPDDETCLKFIADLKWKSGYKCIKCSYKKFYLIAPDFSRKCKGCGYKETPTVNTLLDHVKFPLNKALYIVYAQYTMPELNINKISEDLQLRKATAYTYEKRVKEAIENSVSKKTKDWTELIL